MTFKEFVRSLDLREEMAKWQPASTVSVENARFLDNRRRALFGRCKALGCGQTLANPSRSFAVTNYGDVCDVCWDMYQALRSPIYLKDHLYFTKLHNEWMARGMRRPENDKGGTL
jgi:hypothetical protein